MSFVLGLGCLFVYGALAFDEMHIRSLVLSKTQTQMLCWASVAVAGCLAVYLTILFRINSQPREILLSDKAVIAPRDALSAELVTVNYDTIASVRTIVSGKNRRLVLEHSAGRLSIINQMLKNQSDFDRISSFITMHVKTNSNQ